MEGKIEVGVEVAGEVVGVVMELQALMIGSELQGSGGPSRRLSLPSSWEKRAEDAGSGRLSQKRLCALASEVVYTEAAIMPLEGGQTERVD